MQANQIIQINVKKLQLITVQNFLQTSQNKTHANMTLLINSIIKSTYIRLKCQHCSNRMCQASTRVRH